MKETKHTMTARQVNRTWNESAHPGEPGYGSGCMFGLFLVPFVLLGRVLRPATSYRPAAKSDAA